MIGEMIRWRGLDRTPSGRERAPNGIGEDIEPMRKFLAVHPRQHGPGIGITRRFLNGVLKTGPRRGMLFGAKPREVREASEYGFVWCQLFGITAAQSFAHRARQNAVSVGYSRNDPRDDFVQQRKDFIWVKGAIKSLGPKMGARARVHQLHRDAQQRTRLAQTPLHHVARAKFLADRSHVDSLTCISQSRAAGNDPEIRESRQPDYDLLRQALCQGGDLCVGSVVFERQHGNPKPLPGAGSAGVGFDAGAHAAQSDAEFARGWKTIVGTLLQTTLDHMLQALGQFGPHLPDRAWRIAKDRGGQLRR